MSDLADFLLARISEDEELAQQAATKPWRLDGGFSIAVDAGSVLAVAQHMMRHDPPRVLAECEAKRRIVEMHQCEISDGVPEDRDLHRVSLYCGEDGADHPCPTLRLLALPYADHPDWREEWRRG